MQTELDYLSPTMITGEGLHPEMVFVTAVVNGTFWSYHVATKRIFRKTYWEKHKNTISWLTLSMPGFQKLAQAGGGRIPPPLNSASLYPN